MCAEGVEERAASGLEWQSSGGNSNILYVSQLEYSRKAARCLGALETVGSHLIWVTPRSTALITRDSQHCVYCSFVTTTKSRGSIMVSLSSSSGTRIGIWDPAQRLNTLHIIWRKELLLEEAWNGTFNEGSQVENQSLIKTFIAYYSV